MKCKSCGAEISPSSKFCGICGAANVIEAESSFAEPRKDDSELENILNQYGGHQESSPAVTMAEMNAAAVSPDPEKTANAENYGRDSGESEVSEGAFSEVSAKESESPEPALYESKAPDTVPYESKAPDTASYESKAPETSSYESKAPETSSYENKAPDTAPREETAPSEKQPKPASAPNGGKPCGNMSGEYSRYGQNGYYNPYGYPQSPAFVPPYPENNPQHNNSQNKSGGNKKEKRVIPLGVGIFCIIAVLILSAVCGYLLELCLGSGIDPLRPNQANKISQIIQIETEDLLNG